MRSKKEMKLLKVKTGLKAGGFGSVVSAVGGALGTAGTARSVWQHFGGGRKPLPGMPTQYYS